jgi:exodeoxyribonuclease-3
MARARRLKVATFNVNGIRTRLPHLLQWLERERPDVACLQELKAVDEGFPREEVERAGYGALWVGQRSWNGVAVLARDAEPVESRRALPGDREDAQSRYLEVAAHGLVVGCLYLPNGNPQPGPKFDYKLRWFERLIAHARGLHDSGHPVVLAGDFNVVPSDFDIYDPRHWRKDALLQPESREAYARLLAQGWTDSLRESHPDQRIYTFWDYFRQHWPRDAGLRIDHLLLNEALRPRLLDAGVDRWVRGLEKARDHAPAWVLLKAGTAGQSAPRGQARKPGTVARRKKQARAKAKAGVKTTTRRYDCRNGEAMARTAHKKISRPLLASAPQVTSLQGVPGKAHWMGILLDGLRR